MVADELLRSLQLDDAASIQSMFSAATQGDARQSRSNPDVANMMGISKTVLTLNPTRVLDLALPALEEEDEPGQETNRSYWQQKTSPALLKLADQLLDVINAQGPGLSLKYNKHYIGLQRDGMPDNFIIFRPRKKYMIWDVRIDRNDELDARLEESGLTMLPYDKRWKQYRLQIIPGDMKAQLALFTDLIRLARSLPLVPPLTVVEADSA